MPRTYYRISARSMTEADCHEGHVSRLWVDDGCSDNERAGVSVCRSYDELLTYFAGGTAGVSVGRGACYAGAYLVELEGDESDDEPWESGCGERLIHPTRIISCDPIDETSWSDDLLEVVRERERRDISDGKVVEWDATSCEVVCRWPRAEDP